MIERDEDEEEKEWRRGLKMAESGVGDAALGGFCFLFNVLPHSPPFMTPPSNDLSVSHTVERLQLSIKVMFAIGENWELILKSCTTSYYPDAHTTPHFSVFTGCVCINSKLKEGLFCPSVYTDQKCESNNF